MSVALESLVRFPSEETEGQGVGAQLLGFVAVGGSGALAFVVLSSIFVSLWHGLPNWMISTLCYAVLILPVYLMHRRFSFRSDAPHSRALPRYVGVQVCALLLASLFSYVAYDCFGLPTVWASLIVTGLTSGVTFVVLRLWAFAHPAAEQPAIDDLLPVQEQPS